MSKPRRDIEATYVADRDDWPEYPNHYVKIGHTRIRIPLRSEGFGGSHNQVDELFRHRLNDLQTGSPHKLSLVCAFVAYRSGGIFPAGHLEHWLHDRFAARRVQGEWFNFPAPVIVPREVRAAVDEYARVTGRVMTSPGTYNRDLEPVFTSRLPGRDRYVSFRYHQPMHKCARPAEA